MNNRSHFFCFLLLLSCASVAQAATFCVTSGNQLNIALETAEFNSEHDTIKVATGTHITDRYALGDYQWKFDPGAGEDSDYEYNLTISGGWNGADNCQTQLTLDPAQTVLDARYWGPVFSAALVYADFIGTLQISNLTFYRGEADYEEQNAGILIISGGGINGTQNIVIDNILVSGNRSGMNFTKIAEFGMDEPGTLKVRNSQFLNNSFTHPDSGGLSFYTSNGAEGFFTNNSISGNTATRSLKGLNSFNDVTLSNNAIGDNSSTADPSYDFTSNTPASIVMVNNHFQTRNITGGVPTSDFNNTAGDPAWTLVGTRMVPDAVSPLRDSGENGPAGGVPGIDFSGQPRIVNITIDRGAVEADAPEGVPVGPEITAVSPANGSTTVFKAPIGSGFISKELLFNVSGGTEGGYTQLECLKDPGSSIYFGVASPGETITVGGSITPILVGFDDIFSEPHEGIVNCEVSRDGVLGSSFLTFNFLAVPSGGLAVFDSDPKPSPDPASTIDLTDGTAVIVGSAVTPKALTLYNVGNPGVSDLQVFCGPSEGSNPQISIDPSVFSGNLISPQGSLAVVFDCDTSTTGNFFADYSCNYDVDDTVSPATSDGFAQFRVECNVRNLETMVAPTPPSGTPTTEPVEPGASANFDFSFDQISPDANPPADANLVSCSILNDTHGAFSIQSPAFPGGPYPVVQGVPVAVQVQGSDNAGQTLYTATLHCEFSDTTHPCPAAGDAGCGVADFPLELAVNGSGDFPITVTVSPPEGGTASCTPNPVSPSGSSTCTYSTSQDYGFMDWSGDCTGASCELSNVTSPQSVSANFTLILDPPDPPPGGQTPQPIPTLATWALVLLSGLFVLGGWVSRRR